MKNAFASCKSILFFCCFFYFFLSCKKTGKDSSPTISSYAAATASFGDTVTARGHHLPTDVSAIEVMINSKHLPVVQATPDSFRFYINQSTGSGKVVMNYGGHSIEGPSIDYQYQVIVTTVAGTGGVGTGDGPVHQASFNCPWGIAADDNHDLYIADCYNRLVRKIRASDSTVSTYQLGTLNFYSPYNIALDKAAHTMYVTDFNTHVLKLDAGGTGTVINTTDFKTSTGVAVGPDGNLYLSDNINGTISRMDVSGQHFTVLKQAQTPRNIVFDAAGNLYVAAYFGQPSVYRLTPDGSFTIVGADRASQGWEIARDTAGNFYEADHFNNLIRKIDKNGMTSTIAGSGVAADIDGIGLKAAFNGPQGIAIDGDGNLYVTTFNYDTNGGNKVRKVSFR